MPQTICDIYELDIVDEDSGPCVHETHEIWTVHELSMCLYVPSLKNMVVIII